MAMNKTIKVAAALSAAGVLALTGCSSDSSGDSGDTVNVVGYSVLQQANEGVIKAFNDTDAGKDVDVKGSYGASGDQSRAVVAGQKADEVHLSLEPDVTRLVDEGIVAEGLEGQRHQGHLHARPSSSWSSRRATPKGIDSWDDLAKPGVGIVTPNPASSGSAKWNLLAAYGSVIGDGGSEADADDVHEEASSTTSSRCPDSGRDATTAFTSGTGDVLLSYENEAILARQSGQDFDYVIPDSTLLIENPCALTDGRLRRRRRRSSTSRRARTARSCTPRPATARSIDVGDVEVKGANDESDPFPDAGEAADHRRRLRWLGRGQHEVLRRERRHPHQDPGGSGPVVASAVAVGGRPARKRRSASSAFPDPRRRPSGSASP